TDQIVREVGEQNSKNDVELEETDEATAPLGRGDFGDVHGAQNRRSTDAQAADKAEENQRIPIPREGATKGRDEVENGEDSQTVATAENVARDARGHRADDCPDQGAGDRYTEGEIAQREKLSQGMRGSGNYGSVKSKKETTQGSHEGASEQIGI